MTLQLEQIVVGDRYRKDLGDVSSLAASIDELGLLQPLVVTPARVLVAGQRRLEAVKSLGWTEVDVRIVESASDAAVAIKAERDENVERKAMSAQEMVALGKALEKIERPKAAARIAANLPNGSGEPFEAAHDGLAAETGRVRHEVGKALGISGPTYQRLKTVVDTAQDESQPDEVRLTAERVLAEIDAGKRGVRGGAEEVVALRDRADSPEVGSVRQQQLVQASKKRLVNLVGDLAGRATSLKDINLQLALAGCGPEERSAFIKQLEDSIKVFKAIRQDLIRGIK
jgi:ParB-like chromosome segregation protein Spo0J